MKFTTAGSAVTALTAVAVALGAGAAHADTGASTDPDRVGVQVAPGVEFTGAASDGSSMLTTPVGTVTMQGGNLSIENAARQQVFGAPLRTVANDSAAPAPVTAPAPASPVAGGDVLGDVHTAWGEAGPYTGLAAGIGGMTGGFVGAAVGCPVGAVTLGSMVTVMSAAALTIPGVIGGCMAGAAMGAAVGGMLGAGAVGIPVGAAVTADKYNKLQARRAAAAAGHVVPNS